MNGPLLRFCLLGKFFLASVRLEKVLLIEALVGQVFQYLSMASASGLGSKDMSSVIQLMEQVAGVEVRSK